MRLPVVPFGTFRFGSCLREEKDELTVFFATDGSEGDVAKNDVWMRAASEEKVQKDYEEDGPSLLLHVVYTPDDLKIREIRVPRASVCLPGRGRGIFYEMNVLTDSVDVRFSDATNEGYKGHEGREGREFRCVTDDWRIDVFARKKKEETNVISRHHCIALDRICIWNASQSLA